MNIHKDKKREMFWQYYLKNNNICLCKIGDLNFNLYLIYLSVIDLHL
jgi:hypothetical protein